MPNTKYAAYLIGSVMMVAAPTLEAQKPECQSLWEFRCTEHLHTHNEAPRMTFYPRPIYVTTSTAMVTTTGTSTAS